MNRVKEFRERRGVAAETLAERVGVSERFLRALETDSSAATVEIGFKLAVALSVPFAELFCLEDAPGAKAVFGRVETPNEFEAAEVFELCADLTERDDSGVRVDSAKDVDAEVCVDTAKDFDAEVSVDTAKDVDAEVCVDTAKDVDAEVCVDSAKDFDAEVCVDSAKDFDAEVCVDSAKDFDAEVCVDSAKDFDAEVCVDSAKDVDAEVCVDLAKDVNSEICVDSAAVAGSEVCVDSAEGVEAALQRTALAAKKWAEKSLEIAAACVWNDDKSENGEVGEKGKKGRKRKNVGDEGNRGDGAPGEVRKTRAPRRSEVKSSPTSKTAAEEGLAAPPEGLVDPTAGRPIRFFDLFCGIGGFRFAAERTLAKMRRDGVCALSCDFDPPAQTSYEANFGERPFGDVAQLPSESIPDFDLLFAGFPCQAFSIIGLRKGFADETKGSLFFQIARILHDKRPRAFVLENVRQLTTHDGGRTFETILRILQEELGYCVDWRILNALDCGLPQKRERVAIVGALEPFEIAWPKPKTDGKTLADVLEPDAEVDKKHFASPEIVKRRKEAHSSQYFPAIWHENKSGNISSYPYSCALRAGASYNYLLVNGERRLTPREMLRLQGFPDSFKIKVSDAQIRKQAGNAAPVDLIERVLDRFLPLVFARGGEATATNATLKNAEPTKKTISTNVEPPRNAIPGGLF